jgi:predicted nucleic acid-binding protein
MPEAESAQASAPALLDAGMFIGALLVEDPRHTEARPLVEKARQGVLRACTTAGILSEVYGALTWEQAEPPHNPAEAAEAVRLLVEPPSAIAVLDEQLDALFLALVLAAKHQLRAILLWL